jgi:acetyl esterase/lipase
MDADVLSGRSTSARRPVTERGETLSRRRLTAPPLDPELAALIAAREPLPPAPAARDDMIAAIRQRQPTAADVLAGSSVRHTEMTVPRRGGDGEILISVFRPQTDPAQVQPGFLFVHGGGMVGGNRFLDVEIALEWVETFDVTVITPEYRLAPEHPFPAAMNDVYDVLSWMSSRAPTLGIGPDGLFLAGTSAGGGIAAQVGLLARDLGAPRLLAQVLVCPMLDHRNRTTSSRQITQNGFWNRASNALGWSALLEGSDPNAIPKYASPAVENDLSRLPPTYLDAGSVELFRDEVVDYASRIWAAGGEAELHVWAGGYHAFDILAPQTALSKAARAVRTGWIGRQLQQVRR